jgi:hypothetical protein
MTTTPAPSVGTAAASRCRAASQDISVTPSKRAAPGSVEAAASWANRPSSSVAVRVDAVK